MPQTPAQGRRIATHRHHPPGSRPRARLTGPTVVVLAGLTTISIVAAALVRSAVQDQEQASLEQQAAEVNLILGTGTGEVRSVLQVLANLPLDGPSGLDVFEATARQLVQAPVRYLAVVERGSGPAQVQAGVGEGPAVGDELRGPRAALVAEAAESDDFAVELVRDGEEWRVAMARATPSGLVVVRETRVTPEEPAESVRGQGFNDVDIALYAADRVDPARLVFTTSGDLPLTGRVHTEPFLFGGEEWTLVTRANEHLLAEVAHQAPLVALLLGLLVSAAVAALVEAQGRRRAYATALVETRTRELEVALAEQSALQDHARVAGEEAMAANRSKSEFLSRMSHELRTPLSAVIGFGQLLQTDDLSERQQEAVGHIVKGGRHLLDLINEVLDITRIETGDLSLSPEAVQANTVIEEVVGLVGSLASASGLHLVSGAATCDAFVTADRQRLKQILLNLLSNAIKYNRPGGTVSLSCELVGSSLRISVTDTGPGITEQSLPLVFAPFERLGAERSDVEGTGIGLTLSRRLAEAMGGTLDLHTTLGVGSTFWVELPLAEAPEERLERLAAHHGDSATPEPLTGGPQHRIVYIEDNVANVRLIERILERRGDVELLATMQGRLGIELAREHQPTAIMLDLHLPDMDGDTVLHLLRADPLTADIPVLVLSADATPNQVRRLLAAGASAYLTKPLDITELLDTLDTLLGPADAREPGRPVT